MLVPNQIIKVKWHSSNKQWFIDKGYKFTKIKDTFEVKAEDLKPGSHELVKVSCDYCGTIVLKGYKEYLRGKKSGKDCCSKCQKIKNIDVCLDRYGTTNVFAIDDVKEKIKQTNLIKYGNENIAHGILKEKIKQINIEKYGVPYTTQAPEIIVKMRKSLYENGNVPSSKAEKEICSMIKKLYGEDSCKENFPYDKLNLDCLLTVKNIKIDIEYDGWYWHKDKQKEDKRRNYFLIRRGFKVLRIRSNGKLPSSQNLKQAIEELLNTKKKLKIINVDI